MRWSTKKLSGHLGDWAATTGLVLSTTGAMLIAVAIGEIACTSSTTCGGVVYRIAYVTHPAAFKLGLIMIISGFVFQIFDSLVRNHKILPRVALLRCLGILLLITFILFIAFI